MSVDDFNRYSSMKLFMHNIYEFQKGVRNLVLCTTSAGCAKLVCERLDGLGIGYLTQQVSGGDQVNLYFGNGNCLDAVRTFVHKPLNELTPEEDFILGTMLGYEITRQCERYCKRKQQTA